MSHIPHHTYLSSLSWGMSDYGPPNVVQNEMLSKPCWKMPPLTSRYPHFLFMPEVSSQQEESDSGGKKIGLLLAGSQSQWRSEIERALEDPKIKDTGASVGERGGCLLQTVIIKVVFYKCLRQRADRLWALSSRGTQLEGKWHLHGMWAQLLFTS